MAILSAKHKRMLGMTLNLLSGLALLGYIALGSYPLFSTFTVATLVGVGQLYNTWMVYKKQY